jgi:hypothetical protein
LFGSSPSMLMAFFTGYGASVVRFSWRRRQLALCRLVVEGSNRPGRGQDEKTSGTDQQAVHSGAGRRDSWAPSPLFYLAPRYDPPG